MKWLVALGLSCWLNCGAPQEAFSEDCYMESVLYWRAHAQGPVWGLLRPYLETTDA